MEQSATTVLALLILFSMSLSHRKMRAQDAAFNNSSTKTYLATKVKIPPVADGNIQEAAWQAAEWAGGFTRKGQPVDEKLGTRFKIVYDQQHIYVAIECADPHPDSIPLYPSPRDNPSNDWLEVDFDTNLDRETAYAFAVSPYGTRTDMSITGDDEDFDDRWHPKWEVATSITALGWNIEMKIPCAQIAFSETGQQRWGLQITRCISRLDHYSNWQAMPAGTAGWTSRFGLLEGLSSISVGQPPQVATYDPEQKFAVSALRQDVDLLRDVLEGLHPSLYWYTPKNEIDSMFDAVHADIEMPLTDFLGQSQENSKGLSFVDERYKDSLRIKFCQPVFWITGRSERVSGSVT